MRHVDGAVILAGLVMFFSFASDAAARSDAGAEFSSKATNGYIVSVEGRGRQVELTVDGHGGSATYSVRGRASTRRLKGTFGKLGRIALRYNAVTTDKIAGEAVITGKLANGSVTATKLASGSVRTSQLGTVTRRSVLLEVGTGATDFGSVSCLAGERAISGGGAWVSGINAALAEKLHVVHSFPNSTATSWGTRVFNGSGGTENFNAYVLCLQAG